MRSRPTLGRFLGYRSLPVRKLIDKCKSGATSNVYFLQHKNPNDIATGQVNSFVVCSLQIVDYCPTKSLNTFNVANLFCSNILYRARARACALSQNIYSTLIARLKIVYPNRVDSLFVILCRLVSKSISSRSQRRPPTGALTTPNPEFIIRYNV